jgi:cyclohexyl-isocyanide hydratase
MKIAIPIFNGVTQLDFTAPYEVFSRMPQTEVVLLAETLAPVKCDCGMRVLPDATFESFEQNRQSKIESIGNHPPPLQRSPYGQYFDLIMIPGGPGVSDALESAALMRFLEQNAPSAKYITSVCTGALVLAVAGLLNGYKATTHWLSMDLLRLFPEIEVVEQRVVIDGNRITGGGVTAGLDFALTLAAHIFGQEHAEQSQLMLEYDPAPPFQSGSPHSADPSVIQAIFTEREPVMMRRKAQILELLGK